MIDSIKTAATKEDLLALAPSIGEGPTLSSEYMLRAAALGCMEDAATALLIARRVRGTRPKAEPGLPSTRDVLLQAMREGLSFEEFIAALEKAGIDTTDVGKLEALWDDQAEVELIGEIGPRPAWNASDLYIPANLTEAETRMFDIMPLPAADGAAFGAAAGLGKTRARLLAIKVDTVDRRRKAGGELIAPGRDRKQAAHYYAVPDATLARDIQQRAEEMGLSVYFIRGRGLEDPEYRGLLDESKSRLMCWKDHIRDTAATASSDQKGEMCGTRENPCRALGLCHYSTQAGEIRAMNPDLIIVTHAALRTRPVAGAAIPEVLSLTIDEEFAIGSMLTTTAAGRGQRSAAPVGARPRRCRLSDRGATPALAALEASSPTWAETDQGRPELGGQRRVGRERSAQDRHGPAGRDPMLPVRWRCDFALIRNAFGTFTLPDLRVKSAERLIRVLLACKREVFTPKDWKDGDDRQKLADANWKLMTARDLVEHVIIPALKDDKGGDIPVARFEMVPVHSKAREKTYAPFLAFAFTHGIAAPFRDAPTLFMDATIDTRFLTRLFPNIVTSEYAACPKDPGARIILVNEGYGKSAASTKTGDPSRKTESLWRLFRGLQMAFGERGAGFITHKDVILKSRTEEDADDPLIGWHNNIRGVDAWNGCAALLVAGASTPPPREAEIATEALLGRLVDREPVAEDSPWSAGGFGRVDVVVQQQRSTVTWHRDPDVAAYLHQIVTAGIAQAAARARFVRNPVLLIVVGLALDHLPARIRDRHGLGSGGAGPRRPDVGRGEDRVRPGAGPGAVPLAYGYPRPGTSTSRSTNRRFCGRNWSGKGGGSSSGKCAKGRGRRCRRCGSRVRRRGSGPRRLSRRVLSGSR